MSGYRLRLDTIYNGMLAFLFFFVFFLKWLQAAPLRAIQNNSTLETEELLSKQLCTSRLSHSCGEILIKLLSPSGIYILLVQYTNPFSHIHVLSS